jgi:hypothetical protein
MRSKIRCGHYKTISAGMAREEWLVYGQGYRGIVANSQTGSGAHPASPSMDAGGCIPGGEAAEAWSWTITRPTARTENEWSYSSAPTYVFMTYPMLLRHDYVRHPCCGRGILQSIR